MANQTFEFDLGDKGGSFYFKSWDEAASWAAEEHHRWAWMIGGGYADRWGMANLYNARLMWLRATFDDLRNSGAALGSAMAAIQQLYLTGPEIILHSEGEDGRRVMDIFAALGGEAAAAAAALVTRRAQPNQMQTLVEYRGMAMLLTPALIDGQVIAGELQRERRNLRERADRMLEKLDADERARGEAFQRLLTASRLTAYRSLAKRFRRWRVAFNQGSANAEAAQLAFAEMSQATSEELAATRRAYEEFMHLQAPVKYWEAKAEKHRIAEGWSLLRMLIYFPVAVAVIILIFGGTALWMLTNIQANSSPPPALYFVVSGGLASLAGILFWAGRMFTKLYLSEHHLRHDAEERAVMTTTYLALTKEKAAEQGDRAIILGALFRATSDGIVKEDGMVESGLGQILGRAIGGR